MAIQHDIYFEIVNGKLDPVFGSTDLKKGRETQPGHYRIGTSLYSESYVNTILPNRRCKQRSDPGGKHVRNGSEPLFRRVSRGKYELLANLKLAGYEEAVEEFAEKKLPKDPGPDFESCGFQFISYSADITDCTDPAQIIFLTIDQQPYQRYFRKQRCLHPQHPANGWEERLNAYFWPRLQDSWSRNETKLAEFVTTFSSIKLKAPAASDKRTLENLFRDICRWGGVKYPKISRDRLMTTAQQTLNCIRSGDIPDELPLNSAWTKLYAIAKPNDFVIYDSRVAAAITSILDPYRPRLLRSSAFKRYKDLGYINGRGGSRPRALVHHWDNGYQNWRAQIAANELCASVVKILNRERRKKTTWNLREVEAVLFMEGY